MAKSPRKRITQSIDLRPDSSVVVGDGIIPGTSGSSEPPIPPNTANIISLTTNPISPEINSNFSVTVVISGNFVSDGVALEYYYTRANGSEFGWVGVPPTTDNSATFTLASGLSNGSASVAVRTVQNKTISDQQTLAFNIIGEESLVPFLYTDSYGGGSMQSIPWHGGSGSNYPAGGISFQGHQQIVLQCRNSI
jgi:hypothetical protein